MIIVRPCSNAASTGPRAFTRGLLSRPRKSSASAPLQRGRALSRADWRPTLSHIPDRLPLQRGRALSRADCLICGFSRVFARSFNGAARFHARIGRRDIQLAHGTDASTGPRTFTRGLPRTEPTSATISLASTGPRAFTRGLPRRISRRSTARSRFNGAARFHARIAAVASCTSGNDPCFNGAARFHARIGRPRPLSAYRAKRFNGAARFHARIAKPWRSERPR